MPTIKGARSAGDGELVPGDVHFAAEKITAEGVDDEVVDATGLVVSAGLVDIQINGGFGHDFTQDPTTIWAVGARLPEMGVTSFVPTIVTSPDEVTELALDVVANRRPEGYSGAEVVGLHFEGPWISPEMHGAHNPAHITEPDPEIARRWARSGLVRIVTLAPERPGATDVSRLLAAEGVVVSIGHSAATYQVARDALAGEAGLVTHLFNQMTPLGHREPGVVGAALLSERPAIVIVDGHHVSDPVLELAWRALGPRRVVLVTDAMAALGMPPGTYQLGDGPITVGENGPRTTDGRLAGSIVTLPRAVRNLSEATSATLGEALMAATSNPAHVLGLSDRADLRVGSRADVVLMTPEADVVATYVAGRAAGR